MDALDQDGFYVAYTIQLIYPDEERDLQASGYADGPGTFDFDIESNGATWKVTVCQEEGGDPTPPDPEPPVEPPFQPEPPEGPGKIIMPPGMEGKKLADTGGIVPISAAGALLVAAGMIGFELIRRR